MDNTAPATTPEIDKKRETVETKIVKAIKRHIGSDEMYHIRTNYGKSINSADIRSICEIYSVVDFLDSLPRYMLEPVFIVSWLIFKNPGCAGKKGDIPFESFLHELYINGSKSTKDQLQSFLNRRYYGSDTFAVAIGRIFERIKKMPGIENLNYIKLLKDIESFISGGERAERISRKWAISMLVGWKRPESDTEITPDIETIDNKKS